MNKQIVNYKNDEEMQSIIKAKQTNNITKRKKNEDRR